MHTKPFDEFDSQPTRDDLYLTTTDWQTFDDILSSEHTILAVTVVDSRTADVFLQLTPSPLKRVLSSDVKVYEFPMPFSLRAVIAPDIVALRDDWQGHEDALPIIQDAETAVIHGDVESYSLIDESLDWLFRATEIIKYTDTHVMVNVNYDQPAYLILNDAYYPGWKATVNGEAVPVYRANVMFRAVPVPAGESAVVFTFEPDLWRTALIAGGVLWLLAGLGLLIVWRRQPNRPENRATNLVE